MLGSPLMGLRHRYHWMSVIPVSGQFLLSAPGMERNVGDIHALIAVSYTHLTLPTTPYV